MHKQDFIDTFKVLVSALKSVEITQNIDQLKSFAPHLQDTNHKNNYDIHRDQIHNLLGNSREDLAALGPAFRNIFNIVDSRAKVYQRDNINKLSQAITKDETGAIINNPLFQRLEFLHWQLINIENAVRISFSESSPIKEGWTTIRVRFASDKERFTAQDLADFMSNLTDFVQTIQDESGVSEPVEVLLLETGSPELEFLLWVMLQTANVFGQCAGAFQGFSLLKDGYFSLKKLLPGSSEGKSQDDKLKEIQKILENIKTLEGTPMPDEKKKALTDKLTDRLLKLTESYQIDTHLGETVEDRLGRKWYEKYQLSELLARNSEDSLKLFSNPPEIKSIEAAKTPEADKKEDSTQTPPESPELSPPEDDTKAH